MKIKIKVTDELSAQIYPETDDMIEVDEQDFRQLGITKKFDMETFALIPFVNKDLLRANREEECFPIINRGKIWYDTLTEQQLAELGIWYNAWLNVTATEIVPEKPSWLK